MSEKRPVRVLVVDDSSLVREMISSILSDDPGIEVVGYASDGEQAVAKTLALHPDLVTMDIEMPVLGGLTAIERIMEKRPTPILVVTSITGVRTAFAAVSKGALAVIEKSDVDQDGGAQLVKKAKVLASIDVVRHQATMNRRFGVPVEAKTPGRRGESGRTIVAIAASTGGPQTINSILSQLPGSFPAPIVIAQHVAFGFTEGMAEWLNFGTPLTVAPARHGETIACGRVYLNPSEKSMRVTRQGVILLQEEENGQIYHPSCDFLMRSVAQSYGDQALGVILTGMGEDGVEGARAIREAGGLMLAQDEQSSVIYGMNGMAVKKGHADRVLPLADLPAAIHRLVGALPEKTS